MPQRAAEDHGLLLQIHHHYHLTQCLPLYILYLQIHHHYSLHHHYHLYIMHHIHLRYLFLIDQI